MNNENEAARQMDWREQVLKIRQQAKDKILAPEEAWAMAEATEEKYKNEDIKPTTDILNAYLQLCRTSAQAKPVLQRFSRHVKPNTTTYNILISLASHLHEAQATFDEMLKCRILPNTYTLNGFMPFCRTVKEGRDVLKIMNRHHVEPNTQTYNALISLSSGTAEGAEILEEMRRRKMTINAVTFSSLIAAADDFRDAMMMCQEMKSSGIRPTINLLVTLMKRAESRTGIAQVEREKAAEKLPTSAAWELVLREKMNSTF